jgi:hypothetical protein
MKNREDGQKPLAPGGARWSTFVSLALAAVQQSADLNKILISKGGYPWSINRRDLIGARRRDRGGAQLPAAPATSAFRPEPAFRPMGFTRLTIIPADESW